MIGTISEPTGSWGDVSRRFTMIRWLILPLLSSPTAAAAVAACRRRCRQKSSSDRSGEEIPSVKSSSSFLVKTGEGIGIPVNHRKCHPSPSLPSPGIPLFQLQNPSSPALPPRLSANLNNARAPPPMAIFRSLVSRLSQSPTNSSRLRTIFFLSLTSPSPISPPFFLHTPVQNSPGHFLFRSRFLSPIGGPLFLCNPPWKLSQSATPLLLQPDVTSYVVKLRALNLLQKPSFPHNLRFRPAYDAQKLLAEGLDEKFRNASAVDARGSHGVITDSYLNIPNYISFARLLSGPLLGWMIANDMYSYAFIGLAISGATDWLDGYMARKMGINSVVGSYLDPLADKVLIGCVVLAMVDKDLIPTALVSLVVLRDFALVCGAAYKRASSLDWKRNGWHDFFNLDGAHAQKVEPLLISKLNTVLQLVLVAAALLQPEYGNEETQFFIYVLSWVVASTTVVSTAAYGAQYLRDGTKFVSKSGGIGT
ncbi:CDP-diacylglycerol--glycerol-3-phosphate 3-phosphatidyltransferase 1, chloroplastic [Dorcoceras hygrometricum]|uniref:CDP-diacylglycerol--glycerol-3-phosphate 3-phosphatidyltransferase 1, chloroplastic n=1 Tax=Dorcoceras hygrometricum TaxID=472368 RepID=A0A2Z7CFA2_9LAMI|nr:CDP-diacylglycerol--glycerol-3-phosphate 3-phosphatidyltransferase 1, chloroplastic [Dorcoceras hygrometricum]